MEQSVSKLCLDIMMLIITTSFVFWKLEGYERVITLVAMLMSVVIILFIKKIRRRREILKRLGVLEDEE